jgi:hypothetical protein
MFSLQQNWRRGQSRFCLEVQALEGRGQVGEVAQTMYTHMNKYINNKKEKERKKKQSIWILVGRT